MDRMTCELSDDPECAYITFEYGQMGSIAVPRRFMVRVSKYYPHARPVVTCLEPQFRCAAIAADGEVLSPLLCEQWSAVNSIKTVVQILSRMRMESASTLPYSAPAIIPIGTPQRHGSPRTNGMQCVLSPDSATTVESECVVMEN
jgi:hypothetical protein